MFDIKKVCIIGGDRRQAYLGALLTEDNVSVTYFALDGIDSAQSDYTSLESSVSRCDTVILPMPLSKDKKTLFAPYSDMRIDLDDSLAKALRGKRIFCHNASLLRSSGDYTDAKIYDYGAREELAVLNAVPTAEGAIAAAVHSSDVTLHSSRCLVAGFGRIGKLLSRDLRALGADVTVSARRESDLAMIRACGCRAVKTDSIALSGGYDFIFNTIPALVFTEEVLGRTAKNASVIDLASLPFGVDEDACRRLRINVSRALSIPGKTAPKTAADIIKRTIYNISREENP